MTRPKLNYNLVLFFFFFLIVILLKLSVLSTPYYWDETGWVRAAYWLSDVNLLRAIPGFHPPDTFYGHPPGLHVSMAFLFKLFGGSIWLSHLFIVCFSFVGVYFTYLLSSYLFGRLTGIFSALFLFFTPIYFAQSGMYLGDLPVTAFGVMSIYFGIRKKYLPYLFSSCYLVMLKETGAAIVLAFLIYFFITEFKKEEKIYKEIFKYSMPLWLIGAFLILQKLTSGKFIGIYSFEFDIIKHTLEEFLFDFVAIFKWIFIYQYRYIFTIIIVLNLLFNRRTLLRKEFLLFILIFALAALPFTYFILLPRYLLPSLPYFYIAASWSLINLIKSVKLQTSISLGLTALLIFSLSGSPSYGNNEWNMRYLNMVEMYKTVCKYIEHEFPNSSILTVFPYNVSLREPYLGYVNKSLKVFSYDKEFDDKESDLILFSDPAIDGRELKLKEHALEKEMILVMKTAKEGFTSKLYAKNSLMMAGKINGE